MKKTIKARDLVAGDKYDGHEIASVEVMGIYVRLWFYDGTKATVQSSEDVKQ